MHPIFCWNFFFFKFYFLICLESGFVDQHDDHLSMFSVEEADGKNIYPDIENALKGFSSGDASQQRTREANSNYEWADDIDVLNILHNVNDWPATLQVCEIYSNRQLY